MIKYSKLNLQQIISVSQSLSDVCRNLNMNPSGGNRKTIKKYIKKYKLDTSHFIRSIGNIGNLKKKRLSDILVENSTFSTSHLKDRLYKEGLKERKCELCCQGEEWMGKKMSLILDHKNGIHDDNRIENLRIICPNCNATLDTHCGKNIRKIEKYCNCGKKINKKSTKCIDCHNINQRKTERPDYLSLIEDIKKLGYVGTGKKYKVSDNTIRNWKRKYEINEGN